jgi:hypothetical protein
MTSSLQRGLLCPLVTKVLARDRGYSNDAELLPSPHFPQFPCKSLQNQSKLLILKDRF